MEVTGHMADLGFTWALGNAQDNRDTYVCIQVSTADNCQSYKTNLISGVCGVQVDFATHPNHNLASSAERSDEDLSIQERSVETGSFYSIHSDNEQNFDIAQCDSASDTGFCGTCLEKCAAQSFDKYSYKQTGQVKSFDTDQILTILMSLSVDRDLDSESNFIYSFDRSEIDEMLLFMTN